MNILWKKVCSFVLCITMVGQLTPAIELNAEKKESQIEVVYSSYNDLEMEYALTDMTLEKNLIFQEQTQSAFADSVDIVIDPSITYQTWEGFGGSLDGATVYKLLSLSQKDQEKVMQDLFDIEKGNAYNLMRISIGCSDFTIDSPGTNGVAYYANKNAGSGYWTYADNMDEDADRDGNNDSDMDLSGFSIQGDIDSGLIEIIKKAQKINPEIEFFASMWSAPAWMKKNNDICWYEGQVDPELRDDCYEVLAEYYCKYIEAYSALGIEITAVTLQNEPDIKIGYPCLMFTAENQLKFAKCLIDAFENHGLNVEIWGLDANEFRTWEYAVPLLESEIAEKIDGIGYHNYGGLPMTYPNSLHESYPDKSFHITEMTVGGAKLVEYMRNWINSYAYWITYYDIDMENRTYGPGPSFWSTPQSTDSDHWSYSQVADDGNGSYQLTAKYNTFGQFSRYIDKGAVRIASSDAEGNISNVAFQNPNGSIVVVVVNRSKAVNGTNVIANTTDQKICISTPEGEFYDMLPGDTIATYTWMPETGDWIDKTHWSINVTDEDSRYLCYQAIDNNFDSFYFTGTDQLAGQYVELNLGKTEEFDQITLFQGAEFQTDYPSRFKIMISNDGASWNTVIADKTGANRITNIKLNEIYNAQYIRIELIESRSAWWNISDIALFNTESVLRLHSEIEYVRLDTKKQWTVEASTNRYTQSYASEIVDGDVNTQWIYQNAQEEGFYLILDFKETKTFDKVSVNFGTEGDYARKIQLYVSDNGEKWIAYGDIQTISDEIEDDNAWVISVIENGATCSARYLKLELKESVSDHWLRINEVDLLSRVTDISWLNRENWNISASVNPDYTHLMVNGSSEGENNRWANGTAQIAGQYVIIDFGDETSFDCINIESQEDYARGLAIKTLDYSAGDVVENEIFCGTGEQGIQTINCDQVYISRYIKLELTEAYDTAYWSIYEINVGLNTLSGYENATKTSCSAVTSEHGTLVERYAIDDSLNTVWTNGENQTKNVTTYLINLGTSQMICGIAINNGSEMWSYLEDYEIYAWNDGEEAKLVAKSEGYMSNTKLFFESQLVKYVWIKAGTTSTVNRQFAIADINIYTSIVE